PLTTALSPLSLHDALPISTGPAGISAANVLAGRHLELQLGTSKTKPNRRFRIRGLLEAFSDGAACQAHQPVKIQRRSPGGLRYTDRKSTRLNSSHSQISYA